MHEYSHVWCHSHIMEVLCHGGGAIADKIHSIFIGESYAEQ